MNKIEINLLGKVPPNATAITLAFKTSGASTALIHRYEGDNSPAVLKGPAGEIDLNVSQGTLKLYLEPLDGSSWELAVSGYSF